MHDKVFSQKILNNTKNSIKLAMKENIEKDFASAALPLVLSDSLALIYPLADLVGFSKPSQ